jgi:hypothetical protein
MEIPSDEEIRLLKEKINHITSLTRLVQTGRFKDYNHLILLRKYKTEVNCSILSIYLNLNTESKKMNLFRFLAFYR